MCLEKNASTLRDFAPWRAWINTIRSYATQESDALGGQPEALALAQAMEDNGCGFLANLSARNMSLGGCFSWSSMFNWEFKTLEVFCPRTCECTKDSSPGSGCPRPLDKGCDEIEKQCLTWKEQHWCGRLNAEVIQAMILYNVADRSILHTAVDLRYFFVLNETSFFCETQATTIKRNKCYKDSKKNKNNRDTELNSTKLPLGMISVYLTLVVIILDHKHGSSGIT